MTTIEMRRTDDLRLHELADLIPDQRPDEWAAFLEDVRERGILEPVRLAPDRVTILDGRHRLRAARELGLPAIPTLPAELDGDSERAYMLRSALLRRHLTDDQRRCLAAELESELVQRRRSEAAKTAAEARWTGCVRAPGGPDASPDRARDRAAQAFSVSSKGVRRAADLRRRDPELFNRVKTGELALPRAEAICKRRELAAALPPAQPDDRRILEGDFREVLADWPADSVDLILTDPPYAHSNLPLYAEVARHAARLLTPGGSLVMYAPNGALDEVIGLGKAAGLRYWWTLALKHTGGATSLPGKDIHVCWKPLVWLVKGHRRTGNFLFDLISDDRREKGYHDWQQGEVAPSRLIEHMTLPGQVVLDPFCGSGTTVVAAERLGRVGRGIDLDPEAVAVARRRLAAVMAGSAATPVPGGRTDGGPGSGLG